MKRYTFNMSYKNQVIYQIFVRNYSKEGTFKEVEKDLKRLKDLHVDIIYLMPIHEIGVVSRKGTYGSPYAIKDYFSISSDLGTLSDFLDLIHTIHQLGMKIILDMVFNHTSPDNVLIDTHPEFYFYKNGQRGNRVGDWTDIVDLDTKREDCQQYLLSVLKYWSDLGVDGFRFDVASTIPLSFFLKARKSLKKGTIFFGECVDVDFGQYLKNIGAVYVPDNELMQAFDYLYNYHWQVEMSQYFSKQISLQYVIDKINDDNPKIIRVNCLENHDKERFANYHLKKDIMLNWLDFVYALNGHAFIYMGQEYGLKHKIALFEKDPVIWPKRKTAIYHLYQKLNQQKQQQINSDQHIQLLDNNTVILKGKKYHL